MKKLIVDKIDDLHDLIAWMAGHVCDEEDCPLGSDAAINWLDTLKPGEHDIPEEHVEAIEWGIADWCEVLSNYEDSEPFETRVEMT